MPGSPLSTCRLTECLLQTKADIEASGLMGPIVGMHDLPNLPMAVASLSSFWNQAAEIVPVLLFSNQVAKSMECMQL